MAVSLAKITRNPVGGGACTSDAAATVTWLDQGLLSSVQGDVLLLYRIASTA